MTSKMWQRIKKRLGVSIIDWTLSVWWVTKEAQEPLETPIGKLPRPQQSVGFTVGPFFGSLDSDGETALMLSVGQPNWLSKWEWFWGAAVVETLMVVKVDPEENIDTVPYDRDAILPPEPVFTVLSAAEVRQRNAGADTWLSDEDIQELQQFAKDRSEEPIIGNRTSA